MAHLTDSTGRLIELGQLIGKGGEGSVYAVVGRPDTLAKVYATAPTPDRIAKIERMSGGGYPGLERISAWPRGVLNKNGVPFGLVMPRFDGRKEMHVLLGPKSRKQQFPDASFAFLVHVALNVARAVAQLHDHDVCVGDMNDRGILVGADGTIRFIDCDSFQVAIGSRLFPCDVGVPEYTPPELQGKSLRDLHRTRNHDAFALAVLVFRTIFMGRHPFAGSFQGGNKEIHEAISECRYVYARDTSRTQMTPPPNMLTIDEGAGGTIAGLFERAFSPSSAQAIGAGRPSAKDWVTTLEFLKGQLVDCPFNAAHQFVQGPKSCPWCELEVRSNVDLFNYIPTIQDEADSIDIDAIWAAIGLLRVPSIPAPISESQIFAEPRPLPPEQEKLRQEARELKNEAQRARDVFNRSVAEVSKAREAVANFLVSKSIQSERASSIQRRLTVLDATETERIVGVRLLYMIAAITAYWGVVVNSNAIVSMAITAAAAPWAIDWLISGFRARWKATLGLKLESARRAAIESDPELKEALTTLELALQASMESSTRARIVAESLEQSARVGADRFNTEVATERRRRDDQIKAAVESHKNALSSLSLLEGAVATLGATLDRRRASLGQQFAAASGLKTQRDSDLKRLRDHDREQQLLAFLDRHFISGAQIEGITASLKATLASYGIETAADISQLNKVKVPGFGPVRTERMLSWRKQVASAFRYVPSRELDPNKVKAIEQKYRAGRQRIARDFSASLAELERKISELSIAIARAKSNADGAVRELAQARADLKAVE